MPGPSLHISAMRNTAQLLSCEVYLPNPARQRRINPEWPGVNTKTLANHLL